MTKLQAVSKPHVDLGYMVQQLCDDLTFAMHKSFKHTIDSTTHDFTIGKKYIRVITCEDGESRSVWGFININEFTNAKGVTFKPGDVLMSAGWKTPALNQPRGNLFQEGGYRIVPGTMTMYGPSYLR